MVTCLRHGDIESLRVSDNDFENSYVTTRSKKTRKSMGPRPMPVRIMDEFKKYVSGLNSEQERIFIDRFNQHRRDKVRKKLGLGDFKFHDLRKTFGSVPAQNGVSTAVTQKLPEYSSPDLTNKVYSNKAMNRISDELGRREFLRRAIQTAAAGAVSTGVASAGSPKMKKIDTGEAIPTRILGKRGVKLPILGYGGAGLVRVWGNPLSLEDRVRLVRYAYDHGVRYYDTAGNYMESQAILGEALKDVRDKVFLTSKVEVIKADRTRKAFEKVLGEFKTDYLDAIMIHGTPGLEQMTVTEAMKVHGELVKLRDEGAVRFIGFSAHSYFDKALALIESDGFDLCMLSYGYIPRGYNQIWTARMTELRNACIAKAHEHGMGIVAMKVIGGGVLGAWSGYIVPGFDKKRLEQLPAAAIRYVLQDKRIHLLTIGMRLKEEVDANIKILSDDTTYTLDDRALLTEFCAKAYESDAIKQMRID